MSSDSGKSSGEPKPLKYIIVNDLGKEIPMIFGLDLPHREVGRNFAIVSAGYVSLTNGVNVWGHMRKPDKEPRPNDAEIIGKALGLL